MNEAPLPAPTRLMSIDALRGFDMMWILGAGTIVQALDKMQPNGVTALLSTQLSHVEWEGFRFYDLIFPLFLFIVGVSMVFSLEKALAQGGRVQVLKRVLRRSLLLYLLGVFYYGGVSKAWPEIQLGGVLHRLALCYLFGALIYAFIRSTRGLWITCAVLLLGYWAALSWVSFPDLKLEPSTVQAVAQRIGSDSPFAIAAAVPERVSGTLEEGRNLTNYVDFLLLPGKKAQHYYINEGLLSTLPAIALTLFGALAGRLLRDGAVSDRDKLTRLLLAGAAAVLLAVLWSYDCPFIKRIWTSSFILLTAGISTLLVAVFYYLIDVRQWRAWCVPFVWIGCNPITLYVGAQVVGPRSVAERLAGGDVQRFFDIRVAQGFGHLVIALLALLLVFAVARFLYRRGIFLRV